MTNVPVSDISILNRLAVDTHRIPTFQETEVCPTTQTACLYEVQYITHVISMVFSTKVIVDE